MRLQTIATFLVTTGVLVLTTPAVGAQGLPAITSAKRAASNAAAATNAHERAMEGGSQQVESSAKSDTASGNTASSVAKAARKNSAMRSSAPSTGTDKGGAATRGQPVSVTTGETSEGGAHELSLTRETFVYTVGGRRDPFLSLLKTGELRPMVSDLRLVTVVFDPTGHSVAILRDFSTKEQYRVKVGQTLGRMRVAQIGPKSVTFTLEELGFSRQEVLTLNDTSRTR